MSNFDQPLEQLAQAFESAGIRYLIGGSMASSVRAEPRMTLDIDLLADIQPRHIRPLIDRLGSDWYADLQTILEALAAGRPFNLIHVATARKFDIFPAVNHFHESELERSTPTPIGPDSRIFPVASHEDILLAKLVCYAQGGQVSTKQRGDIQALLLRGSALDWNYLNYWAARLGVTEILDQAKS